MDSIAPTIIYSHNIGNVIGTNTGEIIGSGGTAGTGCTYLTKVTNANANGATGVADMTETMSMANFVARMNQYVATNNADNTKPQLKMWTLSNGYPVFSN